MGSSPGSLTDPPIPERGVDVALAEFNALRAEIVSNITAQAALVGLGLTALGVIAGFVAKEGGDERLLLGIPPLAMLVALLHAAWSYRSASIGNYIANTLWPYLETQVGELPSWERKARERQLTLPRAIVKGVFIDVPAMALFIAASFFALARLDDHDYLWWLDCLMTLIAIVVPISIALLIRKNAPRSN
jgi:hypothetical protein